jgi:hypothetical protein
VTSILRLVAAGYSANDDSEPGVDEESGLSGRCGDVTTLMLCRYCDPQVCLWGVGLGGWGLVHPVPTCQEATSAGMASTLEAAQRP